jgi:hypothetical protein
MWKFLRAIYSQWGSGVTGSLSAPLFVVAFLTNGAPRSVCAAFAVFSLYMAAYLVWSKEEKEKQKFIEQIQGFPVIRIAPDGFHSDQFSFRCFVITQSGQQVQVGDAVNFYCLRLRLVNSPVTPGKDSVAQGVRATITFYTPDGNKLVTMDGRWSDTPQHAERDRSKDFVTDILTVSIPIGQARNLDIVFKHPDEDECYAVNNDNFAPGVADLRLPNRRLPKGMVIAKVRLQGVYIDCLIDLHFSNEGTGGSLKAVSSCWTNNLREPTPI